MRYRKKPVEVEAMQLTPENRKEVREWCGGFIMPDAAWRASGGKPAYALLVKTLEGSMAAQFGDYIIRGVQGEFYPCRSDIFAATYEAVEQ